MEINPRVVFERMFGGGTHAGRAAGADADRPKHPRLRDRRSARAEPRSRRPGSAALDEYLEYVRETERRIQRAERQADSGPTCPTSRSACRSRSRSTSELHVRPAGARLSGQSDARLHVHDGPRGQPADLSEHRRHRTAPYHLASRQPPAAIAGHTKVNTYHVQLFARFLERLRSTPDGDGSLLDHSVIVYGSGMSDGNGHTGGPVADGGGRQGIDACPWRPAHRDPAADADGEPAA